MFKPASFFLALLASVTYGIKRREAGQGATCTAGTGGNVCCPDTETTDCTDTLRSKCMLDSASGKFTCQRAPAQGSSTKQPANRPNQQPNQRNQPTECADAQDSTAACTGSETCQPKPDGSYGVCKLPQITHQPTECADAQDSTAACTGSETCEPKPDGSYGVCKLPQITHQRSLPACTVDATNLCCPATESTNCGGDVCVVDSSGNYCSGAPAFAAPADCSGADDTSCGEGETCADMSSMGWGWKCLDMSSGANLDFVEAASAKRGPVLCTADSDCDAKLKSTGTHLCVMNKAGDKKICKKKCTDANDKVSCTSWQVCEDSTGNFLCTRK